MGYVKEEFGPRLRRIRRAADITQGELGKMAGTDASAIARYEKGETTPGLDKAYELAVALGVTLDDLLPMQPAAAESEVV